jgi:hypothetical protein
MYGRETGLSGRVERAKGERQRIARGIGLKGRLRDGEGEGEDREGRGRF